MSHRSLPVLAARILACAALSSCGGQGDAVGLPERCLQAGDGAPEFARQIGCLEDFQALASVPLDANLPGARSVKVVQDHADADALYFQNSALYPIHYEFVSTHLSGDPLPVVPQLAEFNATEYYSPERRFTLGAVTWYEEPKVWALELSPYDSASAEMIAALWRGVAADSYFGGSLWFHPTSESIAVEAERLPADVPVITTDQIYAEIDYQPLSLGAGMGRLRFLTAEQLASEYVSYQDILVLDEAPNDISVVQGLVTEEFQTPLSHVNVLSLNRKTPNMGLRGATGNAELRALEGKLIELTVDAAAWRVREVGEEEAAAYWEAHRPEPVTLPPLDLDVTELVDIADVTPEPAAGESLRDAIKTAVLAFGGKAAQYSILARTEGVPVAKAFAVPVHYYDQFMRDNGFYDRVDALLADPAFATDAAQRDAELAALRADMAAAPLDGTFQATLKAKLAADYPGQKMRFRTSTNSEDLDGFPCAGCYESHTGDPADWSDVLDAIRETYASIWLFRTFEERSYYGIDHRSVGMALLVHPNFGDEEANGVAVTANPFDPSGLDPAFYVNVQAGGDVEVVAPPPGVTSDQFLYFFSQPNQPRSYITHSSLIDAGETVLSVKQAYQLGVALDAIHRRFSPAYGPGAGNHGWYAMDVEFKFDDVADPSQPPALYVKQARPYPGRGD
ncbi:PEP/pyruvate-binding domain-containing protein [Nannocystis pusilla]|uniref:PEP/pyruvate-binding domain-containing protein n=1 Tax=Nannocystis pusilla TaxID=889268 RepID=UPI003BF02720